MKRITGPKREELVGSWRRLHDDLKKIVQLLTYLLTHSLTPWCRILFEKLIVTQIVKK
jgi:hypothetical protein